MKIVTNSFPIHEGGWEKVVQAVFQKYPNPHSTHILTSDIVHRSIDAEGRLHTTRLLKKKGSLPSGYFWLSRLNIKSVYVMETSVVDPRSKTMKTQSQNITSRRFADCLETQYYTPHPENRSWTLCENEYKISGNVGIKRIDHTIEEYMASRVLERVKKSRNAIQFVIQHIVNPSRPALKQLASLH